MSRPPLLLGVPLELPQQNVAALDRVIQRGLRILFPQPREALVTFPDRDQI
jgi:hypothetical protein